MGILFRCSTTTFRLARAISSVGAKTMFVLISGIHFAGSPAADSNVASSARHTLNDACVSALTKSQLGYSTFLAASYVNFDANGLASSVLCV